MLGAGAFASSLCGVGQWGKRDFWMCDLSQSGMSEPLDEAAVADVAPQLSLDEAPPAVVASQFLKCAIWAHRLLVNCWVRLQLADVAPQLPLDEASPAAVAPQFF